MTITINEVEYDETTFNEEQTKLLNEVTFNYNITRGKDHELLCLKYSGEQLIKQLEASLKDNQHGESVN